jgi:nucleoside-diphosphate-sugar epimerase
LSVLEMTRLLQRACDRQDLEPNILNQAVGEIAEQELDCTRAESMLDWRAQHEAVPALHETVQWYRRYLNCDERQDARQTSRSTARARASA